MPCFVAVFPVRALKGPGWQSFADRPGHSLYQILVFIPRSPSEDLNIVLWYLSPQHQNALIVFLHFYVSDIILHCIFTQAIELFISKMQQRRQEILDVCMPYLALCFLSVKPRREEQRHRCTIAALISHQGAQLSIKCVSLQFVLVDFRGMVGARCYMDIWQHFDIRYRTYRKIQVLHI